MELAKTHETPVSAMLPNEQGVRIEHRGATIVATLDRPSKLNAIDARIKATFATQIPIIARNPQVYAVVLRASPCRVFSAGGDIREFYDLATSSPVDAAAECDREYSLIWMLDCFSKPTVALMDGAVMGTAAGMVQAVTHRVAGHGYAFQMPETAIGFFPDNGVCRTFARMPHEIGTYLGLTGAAIGRADAYRLGLLTHCIDAGHFDAIVASLADADPIDPILDGLHLDPGPAPIDELAISIERCFSAPTVLDIVDRLARERSNIDWCHRTIAALSANSPLALEVTLQHIRRCRALDLRQTLTVDYRLATRLVVGNDFLEAVRTRLIRKQGSARWRPASLLDLSPEAARRCFDPIPAGELVLPTRQEMQASRI